MDTYAIDVQGLSKRYYKTAQKQLPMRRGFWTAITDPFRALAAGPGLNGKIQRDPFWALRDIDFRLGPGESLGVIGPNGAGKSTLLRVLARITPPTEGVIRLRGLVTPLLGVGTGFVKNLSGRANINLNASLLGMSKKQVAKRFDEIVDFAGLDDFIDMPIKYYSSGMQARLAFSVAAHIVTDILLVDEVLSVGDAEFKGKSLQKMTNLMGEGSTVVYVSHNISSVINFCQKALWLDHGQVVMYGDTEEVTTKYLGSVSKLKHAWKNPHIAPEKQPDQPVHLQLDAPLAELVSFKLCDSDGRSKGIFARNEEIRVKMRYRVLADRMPIVPVIHLHCAARHLVEWEVLVFTSYDWRQKRRRPPGEYISTCLIPANQLNDGDYLFSVALVSPGGKLVRHVKHERLLTCKIIDHFDAEKALGTVSGGVLRPDLKWVCRKSTGDKIESS